MSKVLIAVMCGMLMLSGAACQNKEKDDTMTSGSSSSGGEVKAAADCCSHCAGTQTATASGTCPVCGVKVSKG